jgi:hypothetical protein
MADFPADLAPDHIRKIEDQFSTTVITFENKNEQRFANDHLGKELYEFEWNLVDEAFLTSLRNFFKSKLGQYQTWTFNDNRLGGTDITLRFTEDRLRTSTQDFVFFDVRVGVKLM